MDPSAAACVSTACAESAESPSSWLSAAGSSSTRSSTETGEAMACRSPCCTASRTDTGRLGGGGGVRVASVVGAGAGELVL